MPLPVSSIVTPYVYLLWLEPRDPSTAVVQDQLLATEDYYTAVTDTPAQRFFNGVLIQPFQYDQTVMDTNGLESLSEISRGASVINNAGDKVTPTYPTIGYGPYDFWVTLAWHGARARLWRLAGVNSTFASAEKLFEGQCQTPTFPRGADQIEIMLMSAIARAGVTLQQNTYGGTGGQDGMSANAGKYIPRLFGQSREMDWPLITTTQIYQGNDGPLAQIQAVTQKGNRASVSFQSDVPNFSTLNAAVVSSGMYATCLAGGYVRIGGNNDGPFTFDATGYEPGKSYVSDAAGIITQILDTVSIGTASISTVAFAALSVAQPAIQGFWTGVEKGDALEACGHIMGGIAGWVTDTPEGLITVGQLISPTISGPTDPNCALYLNENDTAVQADGQWTETLILLDLPEPPLQVILGYQPFYFTQTNGLAGGLTPGRIFDLAQQYRTPPSAQSSTIKAAYPYAVAYQPQGFIDQSADAVTEQARQGVLLQTVRRRMELQLQSVQLKNRFQTANLKVGDQIWLKHPRYGLQVGKAFLVVGIAFDADKTIWTLRIWG